MMKCSQFDHFTILTKNEKHCTLIALTPLMDQLLEALKSKDMEAAI